MCNRSTFLSLLFINVNKTDSPALGSIVNFPSCREGTSVPKENPAKRRGRVAAWIRQISARAEEKRIHWFRLLFVCLFVSRIGSDRFGSARLGSGLGRHGFADVNLLPGSAFCLKNGWRWWWRRGWREWWRWSGSQISSEWVICACSALIN